MTILGAQPHDIDISVATGANFVATLRRQSGDWDPTSVIALHIGDVTWQATITDDLASWNVDQADVLEVITGKERAVTTTYSADGVPAVWGLGSMLVDRAAAHALGDGTERLVVEGTGSEVVLVPVGGPPGTTDYDQLENLPDLDLKADVTAVDAETAARIAADEDLQEQIDQGGGGSPTWDSITGKPATFPPALPIAQSDVTGLPAALSAKATTGALAAEATARGDADTALTTALTAKADLVGGVVPTSQIPAVALTVGQVVANRAAMLALTNVQTGDIVVITAGADKGTYMLDGTSDPTVFAHWILLGAPTDVVQTVNGQQGTVVLGKADVGLGSVANALQLIAANNLSDLVNVATARTNLGLGSAATTASTAYDAAGAATAAVTALLTSVVTLTNKRITKRVGAVVDTATLTIASDSCDVAVVTALAQSMTVAAPTGTPTQGQSLVIRIKDAGTSQALTWNGTFRAVGVTLPATTVVGKTLYVGCMANTTDGKWDVIAVAQEA